MRRRLVGLIWTITVTALLVRRFLPSAWTHGCRLARAMAAAVRGPQLTPAPVTDTSPAETGLVPDPTAPL